MKMEIIDTESTSAWLRSETGISDDDVYNDLQRSSERKRKAFLQESHHEKPKGLKRVPDAWEPLGKRRANGLILECGRFLELWISAEEYHIGAGVAGLKLAKTNKTPEDEASIAARVNARARKQIRRIVNANDFRAMHTLTIAPPSVLNDRQYQTISYAEQKDYNTVRRLFKLFIQRLNRALRVKSLPYLVVLELHDSAKTSPLKRGCWHLHLAMLVDAKIESAIKRAWKHGRIDSQDFRFDKAGNARDRDICNPGAYIAEYIGKEGAQFGDATLRHKKRYTCSRAVKRPIKVEIDGSGIAGNLETLIHKGKQYTCLYYKATTMPGSVLCSHTAHYVEKTP